MFSTKDKDNDRFKTSCAQMFEGGWWFKDCLQSHLNGKYIRGEHSDSGDGIVWKGWKGEYYSLKTTRMMVKRH